MTWTTSGNVYVSPQHYDCLYPASFIKQPSAGFSVRCSGNLMWGNLIQIENAVFAYNIFCGGNYSNIKGSITVIVIGRWK